MKGKIQSFFMLSLAAVTAVLLLTSCFGGNNEEAAQPPPEAESPALLTGNVVLSCTQACTDRGQCGTLADGRVVILGNFEGPAVINHNLTLPADATAVIQETSTNVIETVANPTRSEQTFYQVVLSDNSKMGWVASWCVNPSQ
ncbi:MAG: hypothetical protein DWQ04_09285 [Chloroflexi bacterium]|nr:MAG: hypothetical protein DWQ04_09285 [Chloroflexota bacterium]